jgi:DNA topoisomerase IA
LLNHQQRPEKLVDTSATDYVVEASVGHIRDLPQRAADIPKEYKKIRLGQRGRRY